MLVHTFELYLLNTFFRQSNIFGFINLLFNLCSKIFCFALKDTMRKNICLTPLRGAPKPFLLYAKLTSLADAMLRLLEDHKTD